MNSSNLNIFNSENPLSDDEFQTILDFGSFANDSEVEINNYDDKWFINDGLFPYVDNSSDSTVTNCSEQMKFFSEMNRFYSPSQIIVPVIYSIICLVGLIGNGLVMFVILGNKEMTKTVANIYIWNLAIADTLFLISLPFTSTQRVLLSWPFGAGVCKIVEAVKYLNYFASVFFLTAMSVDRYIAVVHVASSNKWRTSRNTFFVCSLIWLISLVMVIPLFIYTQVHGDICALVFNTQETMKPTETLTEESFSEILGLEYSDYINGDCDQISYFDYAGFEPLGSGAADFNYSDKMNKSINATDNFKTVCKHPNSRTFHVFLIFTFVIGFVIPFFVITLCYILIVVRLVQPSEIRAKSKQAERTRRKVTRMVVVLVITFFTCWLPFYLWHLLQIRGVEANLGVCHNVRDFTFCLGYANSCLNPILYTFLGHNFHERLRKRIAVSLRSFSFNTFGRLTVNNTVSRADTGGLSRKFEGSNAEANDNQNTQKLTPLLVQVKEDEEMPSPAVSCNCLTEKQAEEQTEKV